MLRVLPLLSIFFFGSICAAAERPNVVFMIADDYCTALQSYGREQCRTPNLDRLAKSGVSFDNAYCQFSVCGPSRASLMCGMYPVATGVLHNRGNFRLKLRDHTTMSQLFRKHGYWSGRVSKIYHMGVPGDIASGSDGVDDRASWDIALNVKSAESETPGKKENLSPNVKHGGVAFVRIEGEDGDLEQADGQAATKAIELLEQRAKDRKPFFLAVGFVRPHVPLVAPKKWFEPFPPSEMKLPPQIAGDLADLPSAAKKQTNSVKYGMNDRQARHVLSGYFASVAYMDAQVGRVLDALDRLKLRENTIVVFTSDHGYHLGEHTMWQKLSLFEEGSKVPLIVSAPGQKATGKRTSQIVELIDIYPTLAELASLDVPTAVQGTNFRKLLDDPQAATAKQDAYTIIPHAEALRTKRWKYMEFGRSKLRSKGDARGHRVANAALFDLENDPHELNNLAGQPKVKRIEAKLKRRLRIVREQARQPGPRPD